jgi:hypothetical protein
MTWRKHTIHKIYNLGKEDEVMCYGSIEFTGLDGSKGTGEYAMRFVFERVEGGGVKIALEDVFGVCSIFSFLWGGWQEMFVLILGNLDTA